MDLQKELSKNQAMLVIVKSKNYPKLVNEAASQFSEESICYITLNKTFESLKESFKSKNIPTDNIVFIDAITPTIVESPGQTAGCYFASSPAAMPEISALVSKLLGHEFRLFVFDSITSLLVYNKDAPVAKFIQRLVNEIKFSNAKALFYALDIKEHESVLEECAMVFDKVIR